MDVGRQSASWDDGETVDATMDPVISVSAIEEEDVPALTVATIAGVAVVVLLTIAAVFLLGVLLDCRQQRILERRMGEIKRKKRARVVKRHPEADDVSIAQNMEEPDISLPPAVVIESIR